MNYWPTKIHKGTINRIALVLFLSLALGLTGRAQNTVLIVSDQYSAVGDLSQLDPILRDLRFISSHAEALPERLDPHEFSLVILAANASQKCIALREYVEEGGCLILTGQVPYDLILHCDPAANISDWLGFGSYLNGSGELMAAEDLPQIDLPRDSLLDRTTCNPAFGGLDNPRNRAEILAKWVCPLNQATAAAVTCNQFGRGKVFYFSRLFSTIRVKGLLSWALGTGIEYRWGDANNSRNVDISDAVFIIGYVFEAGPGPSVLNSGDANGDGSVNISDAVYLISYIFSAGTPPRAGRVN